MKVLLSLSADPDLILPIWKTDTNDYLIKVKTKHMIYPSAHLKPMEIYDVNFEFTSFDFQNKEYKQLRGYYSKVISLGCRGKEKEKEKENIIEGIDSLDELDI